MSRDEQAPGRPHEPSLPPGRGVGLSSVLRRGAVAFGRFWWDFLVGETPELLVGSLVAVGAAALLVHSGALRVIVVGALPVLVVVVLALSTFRARARLRARSGSGRGPAPVSGGSGTR